MVVSLVLGFLAMFVATIGMKCTRCGGDDKVKKARIAMTGGIIFIVAGKSQVQEGLQGSPLSHPGGVMVGKVLVWGLTISESSFSPGLAALIACSWYGHKIVTDFYNPLVPMNIK